MIGFKKFFKSIGILNSSDPTKELEVTVADTTTSGAKVTLVVNATEDRVLYLPDVSGTLSTGGEVIVTPNRALVSDNDGKIAPSIITTTELNALDNISGNIETKLSKALLNDGTVLLNNNTPLEGRDTFNQPVDLISVSGSTVKVGDTLSPIRLQNSLTNIESSSNITVNATSNTTLSSATLAVNTTGGINVNSSGGSLTVATTAATLAPTGDVILNPGGVVDASNKRIISVAAPIAAADAVNKSYVDSKIQPIIVAKRQTSNIQSITGLATVELNYATLVFEQGITTSAGPFSAVAPVTGYYSISADMWFQGVQLNLNDRIDLAVKIDSTSYPIGKCIAPSSTGVCTRFVQGTGLFYIVQGQVIKITATNTSTSITVTTANAPSYVNINFVGV